MVNNIKNVFEIQDLGEPSQLLGIKIHRKVDGNIHISQPSFIDAISNRFNITAGHPINTLMDPTIELHASIEEDMILDVPYASLIGSINYCAVSTRPDIAFAVNKCTQFTSRPNLIHWTAAKRILCYLIQTKDYGIQYGTNEHRVEGYTHCLAGFTDTDFAGDINDRKSTSGWIFTYNNSAISWTSKKQTGVFRSTMEAELIAGSSASAEAVWLMRLARDFKLSFMPIPIFTDNTSFISFANNDVNNNRTKHIDTHYHYTRDQVTLGNIVLHYVHTNENPADVLMKPLSPRKHACLLATHDLTMLEEHAA